MAVGNSPKITLSEDDINRVSLRGKTPSQLTIPELKRWLSSRKGAKYIEWNEAISGRKVNTCEYLIFLAYFI